MKISELDLVDTIIRFNKDVELLEAYPEAGMHAKVVKVNPDNDGVVVLTVNYQDFDEENKHLETPNYFDRNGYAHLTARESGNYKTTEDLYLMGEHEASNYFDIVKMSTLNQAIEYVQKLLGVTELNLDEWKWMEPETRKVVQEASEWVTQFE